MDLSSPWQLEEAPAASVHQEVGGEKLIDGWIIIVYFCLFFQNSQQTQ